jgi:hypothetical protein
MDPRSDLDVVAKRKKTCPAGNGTPVVHPIS